MVTVTMPLSALVLIISLVLPSLSEGSVYHVFNRIDANTVGPFFRPIEVQPYSIYDQFIASPYFQIKQKTTTQEKGEEYEKVKEYVSASKKQRRFQKLISNDLDQNKQDQEIESDIVRSFRFDLHPEEKLALAFLD